MKRTILIAIGWLLLGITAQAASFDCAKAGTKVEHIVCDNPDISKLDDELSQSYKAARQNNAQADNIKQAQMQWMRERNGCADAACVKGAYEERNKALSKPEQKQTGKHERKSDIGKRSVSSESYSLVMSKNDELCNHMLQMFNEDLKTYGWNGDAHQEEHDEFRQVPWKFAQFSSVINGRIEYTDVEGALFDFNNDGAWDYVVRWKSSLSNARADLVFMLGSETVERKTDLNSKELGGAKNQIYLAGWWYNLTPPYSSIAGVRVLEPFIYHGTSYLVMRPLYEEMRTIFGYTAITKYGGGKFINRELTGKMEDICYFNRSRANRAH